MSFEKDFWTRVLGEKNLESPGYHEAVRDTIEKTKLKQTTENHKETPKKGKKNK